ncbi:MAG: hypothetical protein JO214_13405 [Frankiaceae bacterium]|nr:hypothetical protein [Frankiaceae bacterium]
MSSRSSRVGLATLGAITSVVVALPAHVASAAHHSSWSSGVRIDGQNPVIDVTCASSHLCLVGGASGLFVSTHPKSGAASWSRSVVPPARPGTAPAVYGVSCPSTSFCVAVGTDTILTSHDPAGGAAAWKTTRVSVPKGQQLFKVACASPRSCVAIEIATRFHSTGLKPPNVGYVLASKHPDGKATAWKQKKLGEEPDSVECAAPRLCLVGTRSGNVLSSKHPTRGAWKSAHIFGKKGLEADINAVACSSTHDCVAAAVCSCGASSLLTTKHPTHGGSFRWRSINYHPRRSALVIVSADCVSHRRCAVSAPGLNFRTGASTKKGTVYSGKGVKGRHWGRVTVPGSGGPVSCASKKLCVLLGGHGKLFVGHL